ncbi:hypothetical protein PsalN5692_00299 [Piscirickettsia salmonis]|nr:hypothetical protein PsalN5692_00299 [Piscirickettsia salmonis]QGP56372.1 hypothetical protein PsalSR1_03850 [Piscirickettsia salmonis]QGP65935.1 hypothetical protein PsalMR5_03849 [Piscirickettsia salmonis]
MKLYSLIHHYLVYQQVSIFDNIDEVNFEEDSQEEEEFAMPFPKGCL